MAMVLAILAGGCASPQLPETPVPQPLPGERAPTAAEPAPGVSEPALAPLPREPARRLALLLPLSGAQRGPAEALRDGFIAAYLADGEPERRPALLILDEESPSPAGAYQAALDQGAQIIVGPLLKTSVAQVLPQAGAVTTIALNQLDAGIETPWNFYQFSLAPEDEAREAAARAAADGRYRALALAPDNEWGRRVLGAFLPAIEAQGGSLLAYRLYDPRETDFTAQIQRLLLVDESRDRHRQLSANLGVNLGFEPRRRTDVDFIFLAANVANGRMLWPQLRFLYAGDIPTYATSAIHIPGGGGDMDLDGIMFTDVPAVLGTSPQAQGLREAIVTRWPAGSVGLMRFHAMGFDAYALAKAASVGAELRLTGLTGRLQADAGRRIERRTDWAEFRNGGITPLPAR